MSDLDKLRKRLAKARGQVGRWEREVAELREEYREAHDADRVFITRRGQAARLALDLAREELARAEIACNAEESRLLAPDAKLRFT